MRVAFEKISENILMGPTLIISTTGEYQHKVNGINGTAPLENEIKPIHLEKCHQDEKRA